MIASLFIDGEHTDIACFRDFLWTLPLMKSDAIILFHDSTLVYKALRMIGLSTRKSGQRHVLAKNNESDVTALFLGKFADIDFAREFGEAANWDEFFERSETEVIQHVLKNRVSIQFDAVVTPVRTFPA